MRFWLILVVLASMAGAAVEPENPIEVYFTQKDRVSRHLYSYLEGAKKTIYAAVFQVGDADFADRLIEKKKQGLEIRVVSDADYQNFPQARKLILAGIPVVFDSQKAFMHHKFVVIDGEIVWTGSANMTQGCLYYNRNNSIVFYSKEIARRFTQEFEKLFVQQDFGESWDFSGLNLPYKIGATELRLYFSPQSNLDLILLQSLDQARQSIVIAAYALTHPRLIQKIKERIQAGIEVTIILDARMSRQKSSVKKQIPEKHIRIYHGKGKLHHKFIVVDYHTVITGSFNFSKNAVWKNNENLLIIKSADLAVEYMNEFDRLLEAKQD